MRDGECLIYSKRFVGIAFTGEEDKVCCAYCPLLETYSRKQCRATGEYIINDRLQGFNCPLMTAEETEELLSSYKGMLIRKVKTEDESD